jgi:hypothetical protein
LGALLLFSMQPLAGHVVLPVLGGGFQVWATCLMFFQGMLFVGYLYSHLLGARRLWPHLILAASSLLFLPLDVQIPPAPAAPVPALIVALLAGLGLPALVLTSTSVLAQAWMSLESDAADPYPLYAASSAGSLIGLLLLPLAAETLQGQAAQRHSWTLLYLLYLVALLPIASVAKWWRDAGYAPAMLVRRRAFSWGAATRRRWPLWLLLTAAPSAFLLAVTNILSQELGSAPEVWVLPLAVYLLSYVFAFRRRPGMPRLVLWLWPAGALVGTFLYLHQGIGAEPWAAGYHIALLFVICLVAHGELYRSRPPVEQLSSFYLMVALGGWIGGAFVALVAPVVFDRFHEYPLALLVMGSTLLVGRRQRLAEVLRGGGRWALAGTAVFAVFVLIRIGSMESEQRKLEDVVLRNHYGVYSVRQGNVPGTRVLYHGKTMHGVQLLTPEGRSEARGYYHRDSPLGEVIGRLEAPRRIAAVGLGIGSTTALLEAGDRIVFFEIDKKVVDLARRHFTHLDDSVAEVEVAIGDARLRLADLPDRSQDLIVLDAFTGDSIPTHLMTVEALRLCQRKLSRGGLIIAHISSRHYDFRPVLRANADLLGLVGASKDRPTNPATLETASRWFLMGQRIADLQPYFEDGWIDERRLRQARPWSDNFHNLLEVWRPRLEFQERRSKGGR